jgi:hypothetical protein
MAAEETREFTIQIVSVELDKALKNQKGTAYTGAEVIYKDEEGKVVTKVMHNNTFKFNNDLLEQLKAVKPGQFAKVTAVKTGQFVNWQSVEMVDAPAKTPSETSTPGVASLVASIKAQVETPSKTQVRSNYETPEERAARQVMIVRQSSITAALKLAELGLIAGGQAFFTEDEIITSAKVFEAYVLGTGASEEATTTVNLPD